MYNEYGEKLTESWLDEDELQEFERFENCLVEQYSRKCMVASNGTRYCIDGNSTIGDDIADNAGLRKLYSFYTYNYPILGAAFRAYRNWIEVNGPDERLSGKLTSQMTDDQLFFVISAQKNWCSPSKFISALGDAHSPSRARTNGVLENFPAFRSAFNCPAGSRYGRKKHCQVWVQEN
jgi:predicted metalloendopeptidase